MSSNYSHSIEPHQQQLLDDDDDPEKELEYTPNFSNIFSSNSSTNGSNDRSPRPNNLVFLQPRPTNRYQTSSNHVHSTLSGSQTFQYQPAHQSSYRPVQPLAQPLQQVNQFVQDSPNTLLNQLLSDNNLHQAPYQCSINGPVQSYPSPFNANHQPPQYLDNRSYVVPNNSFSNPNLQSRPLSNSQYQTRMTLVQRSSSNYAPPPSYTVVRHPNSGRAPNRAGYPRQPSLMPIKPPNQQLSTSNTNGQIILTSTAEPTTFNYDNSHTSFSNSIIPASSPNVRTVANATCVYTSVANQNQITPPQNATGTQQMRQHAQTQSSPNTNTFSRNRTSLLRNDSASQTVFRPQPTPPNLSTPLSSAAAQQVSPTTQASFPPQQAPVSVSSTTRSASLQNIDCLPKSDPVLLNKACQVSITSKQMVNKRLSIKPTTLDQACQTELDQSKEYVDRACSPIPFSRVAFKHTPKRNKVRQPSPASSDQDSDDEIDIMD